MILSFINIRKVPRAMLKTSGFALGFQHLPRDLANINEWKIMFDLYIVCLEQLRMSSLIPKDQKKKLWLSTGRRFRATTRHLNQLQWR